MKKTVIVVIALILFGLLFYGGKAASQKEITPTGSQATAIGALSLSEKSFDFGTISMKKGTVSHRFPLLNIAESPFAVRTITTSCMCTNAYLVVGESRKGPFGMPGHGFVPPVNESIPVKSKLDVEVVFDPSAHGPAGVGRIERAVFIEDENGGTETITIKALVTP